MARTALWHLLALLGGIATLDRVGSPARGWRERLASAGATWPSCEGRRQMASVAWRGELRVCRVAVQEAVSVQEQ